MSRIYNHQRGCGKMPQGYSAFDPVDSRYYYDVNTSHSRNYYYHNEDRRKLGDNAHIRNHLDRDFAPFLKRRKFSTSSWEGSGRHPKTYNHDQFKSDQYVETIGPNGVSACENSSTLPAHTMSHGNACTLITNKRGRTKIEDADTDMSFMSRDEIERCSPSRKDGIDAMHEMHLRYSYCAFLKNLGLQLDLPQTTIGSSIVLCHRFFVRRSHACHDRFLIATAALFLAAKSEDTPRPLNDVLRLSSEIVHKQHFTYLTHRFPIDWFEKYKERVFEAEHLILTSLNFELHVHHPYDPLTSILNKIGFAQSLLVTLALSLISEGLRSSLWLQFKPHQIAAGAAFLASKYLKMNLSSSHNIWKEFETPSFILEDVAQQLMELF
ncbi:cyclin-T1-3-like [Impatiens glandulifera]|uniref:cyclin-T1-3-like n=1 Tax=Impatiens glandulifera TaxID=253017 RepID=UPI001FB16BC6|nr:cyclin-T1-3-like [Impatiens glandulifera]XP_047316007.1 cyclin-T1-3-like [Impatiens glandulifera]